MEQQNPKLPIPRLPSTSQKTFKKFKSPSSKVAVRRLRQLSRIYIGDCFKRWRDFRDLHGLKTDEELAKYLLDRDPNHDRQPTFDKQGLPRRYKLRPEDPRRYGLLSGVPAPSTEELLQHLRTRCDGKTLPQT
uniref:Uncharacterized protein n=1 Tax=Nothobranchius rachovii TaxID=451742 RepID=A0A1A8RPZ0_9TELE